MDEAKRRTLDNSDLASLQRRLADSGKLIESGWIGLRIACIPLDAPAIQVQEMRDAFMAGAMYLFSSIMTILEPGKEPTDKDLNRLSLIDEELKTFIADFELRYVRTEGQA